MAAVSQLVRILRRSGWRGVRLRLFRRLAQQFPAAEIPFVRQDDLLAVDPQAPPPVRNELSVTDRSLIVNWVMSPPAEGSGGHTTVLRMVEYLESKGHVCRLYLDDRFDGDVRRHEDLIRRVFPGVVAAVADARAGLAEAHVSVATSWGTAYRLAADPSAGRRVYFVQDYEPWFSPVGAEYVIAENTYRLGFHGITAGRWLDHKLSTEFGMTCDHFAFGCDTAVYQLENLGSRPGVAFYAKPSTPRRAYDLGIAALTLLHRQRPDTVIHLFGERIPAPPVPCVNHGVVSPAQLNRIYNDCAAGLALSMTNVSLIPWELLASGAVPVVNDAVHNRMVLDNPAVAWSPPTPHGLARVLGDVLDRGHTGSLARDASRSVQAADWSDAGQSVETALLRLVTQTAPSATSL
jgi:hypothetical protein